MPDPVTQPEGDHADCKARGADVAGDLPGARAQKGAPHAILDIGSGPLAGDAWAVPGTPVTDRNLSHTLLD